MWKDEEYSAVFGIFNILNDMKLTGKFLVDFVYDTNTLRVHELCDIYFWSAIKFTFNCLIIKLIKMIAGIRNYGKDPKNQNKN